MKLLGHKILGIVPIEDPIVYSTSVGSSTLGSRLRHIQCVGDKVVSERITNQHYVLKRNKLMDVNKMNKMELRQIEISRRLTARKTHGGTQEYKCIIQS